MNTTPKTCENHLSRLLYQIEDMPFTVQAETAIMNDYHKPEDEIILRFLEAVTLFDTSRIAEFLADDGNYEIMQTCNMQQAFLVPKKRSL